jgi:hypothetical protein
VNALIHAAAAIAAYHELVAALGLQSEGLADPRQVALSATAAGLVSEIREQLDSEFSEAGGFTNEQMSDWKRGENARSRRAVSASRSSTSSSRTAAKACCEEVTAVTTSRWVLIPARPHRWSGTTILDPSADGTAALGSSPDLTTPAAGATL